MRFVKDESNNRANFSKKFCLNQQPKSRIQIRIQTHVELQVIKTIQCYKLLSGRDMCFTFRLRVYSFNGKLRVFYTIIAKIVSRIQITKFCQLGENVFSNKIPINSYSESRKFKNNKYYFTISHLFA